MNKRGNVENLVLLVISLAVVVAISTSFFANFPKIKAAGNVYYVDFDNGNDAATGTSISTAWRTIPGTRNVGDTGWQQTSWGGGVVSSTNKVQPGTTFILKQGSSHDSSNGGYILMDNTYYQDATASNPIKFTINQNWGTGSATFDATGMTASIAIVYIKEINGVEFDGVYRYGIVFQDSPSDGVRIGSSSITVYDASFKNVKFYNHGTSKTTDPAGAGYAHLHYRNTIGGSVSNVEFDGNKNGCGSGCYINGFLGGESGNQAKNLIVSDSIAHDLKGSTAGNDAGIGLKAYNSEITFRNIESYNNLKGFDLGEVSGNNVDITYKIIDSTARNNEWGINLNSMGSNLYTGKVDFYLINNIIRDNNIIGSNIYAGPFNLYIVHNVYDNNGIGSSGQRGSIKISPDSCNDQSKINAYMYNNVFYKPANQRNFYTGYIGDGTSGCDTDLNLDFDYNSWVQKSSELFAEWAYYSCGCRVTGVAYTFNYGANGPGHSSGNWYSEEGEPAMGTGHLNVDSHSKGTLANNPTLPPFTDIVNHDYTLTTNYLGTDLSTKPWYIPEMGLDRNENTRVNWDIGAYEYVPGGPTTTSTTSSTTSTSTTSTTTTTIKQYEEIWLEAESGILYGNMKIGTNDGAFGSKYINSSDALDTSKVDYNIYTNYNDEYVMWGRVISNDGNQNSFHVLTDIEASDIWDVLQDRHSSQWTWTNISGRGSGTADNQQYRPRYFTFTPGDHVLTIKAREANTDLDRLAITNKIALLTLYPSTVDPAKTVTATILRTQKTYTKANVCDSNGCKSDGSCVGSVASTNCANIPLTQTDLGGNLYCTFNAPSIAGNHVYYGCLDANNDYEIINIPSWGGPTKKPVSTKVPGSGDVIQPK